MRIVLFLSRLITGVLFIFSGLIKANDPLGLSYKMQEFFEVWGWDSFNDFTLALSVLMIAFEIIAGVAVLVGWRFRLFAWLLLLLILFFTFLTGYALLSGKIRECGCFGDCIKLTAKESFIKDLILTALIFVLFYYRDKVKPSLTSKASFVILTATTLFSFLIQLYVLRHLPILDCLPFRKGSNLAENMKIPPGSIPDSTVIQFVYEKDSKQVEFDADHFPEDFNDSAYKFVKRYDKVVRKGNAQPPIKDFVMITESGNDTTQAILTQPGKMAVLFIKTPPAEPKAWKFGENLQQIATAIKSAQIPVIVVTADATATQNGLSYWKLQDLKVLKGDLVAIKTAARTDPALYLLDQGTVMHKWSWADFKDAAKSLGNK
ncbi:BT_3928 family protein [Pollutibacter soli]|uniref:BT_3928 family protein n=1 Tax=Pollutibacter soli TaxID=3034157 RepID=UPI0030139633